MDALNGMIVSDSDTRSMLSCHFIVSVYVILSLSEENQFREEEGPNC